MKGLHERREQPMNPLIRLAHWVYGEPRPEHDVRKQLAELEPMEQATGKTTLTGELLRFDLARRRLVETLFNRP